MARKPTEYVQFKLRIRESLRRKIEKAAEKKAQSANAEAVERIEYTFDEEDRWEATAKEMEERQDELNQQAREYYEEQAREKMEHEAALRDSKILNMLVDNKYAAILIRLIFKKELEQNPNWAATTESKKAFADRLHHIITHTDFEGDFE
jgi:hypothetical protein